MFDFSSPYKKSETNHVLLRDTNEKIMAKNRACGCIDKSETVFFYHFTFSLYNNLISALNSLLLQ